MLKLLPSLLFILAASAVVLPRNKLFINHINSAQKLWTAEHYTTPFEVKNLMKVEHVAAHLDKDIKLAETADSIPDSYDVRDHWPQCISVNNIRDQSHCGSCWAVAAAEAISDRTCIASNGDVNTLLSAEDILTCCTGKFNCGDG